MSKHTELRVRRRNSRLVIPDVQDSKTVGSIIGYAEEPLLPLADACIPLIPIIFNILAYVSTALEHTPDYPSDGLTRDESASIFLYTTEWKDEHRSLYSALNETLRTADPEQLQPWFKYLKLLLTALVKIPFAPQQTVWRGIRKDLRLEFPRGTSVIWWSFSSCTTTLPVLENDLYLGYEDQNCSSFVRKDDWDTPDNDILPSPVHEPDYASCCKQCQTTTGCIAFTYSPSTQLCWPKRSMGSGGNSTADRITAYNPNNCSSFVRKDAWDILGNDILSSSVQQPDYASCCLQCQTTPKCVAFTYSSSRHGCWLKTSIRSGENSTGDRITGYNPNTCSDFVRKDAWDIPGNDILTSSVQQPDYASCCLQCQTTSGCIAFSYSPSSHGCSLKTSIGSGGTSTDDKITGYNPNMCVGFVRKDAWDIPGNDILTSFVQQLDYASCCSQCQATSGCIAFTYSPSSQRCSLKTSMRSGENSTGDRITGYNPNTCSDFVRKDAWDIPGNDILSSSVQQPDYASCCLQCQTTPGCVAFTYSPSSHGCLLKTSIGSGGISTGDKITGYIPNTCSGFVRKDNWDISGNDILPSPLQEPDYASCCSKCETTSECVAFTYSQSSQQCSLKANSCSGGTSAGDRISGYNRDCSCFVRKDNWNILGNDILTSPLQEPDYASCCSECQATSGCFAFTYSPSNKQCSLKTSMGNEGNSTGDRITGYNSNMCGGFLRIDNWDISGNDILPFPGQQSDYASCCSQCQATYRCAAFTYSPSSQQCLLKTSMGSGGNATTDSITGYSIYPLRGSSTDILPNALWQQNGITVAGGNGEGNGTNQLNGPVALYVDDNQAIYVADVLNDRIMEWKLGATNGQVVAGGNGRGNGANQLNSPADVIIDKETDSLIICDGNGRVVRWPRRNGTSGETIISNISCVGLTIDEKGFLYVVDRIRNEVRRYRRGESQGTVIAGGNGQGNRLNQLSSPQYVFVDRDHSVYVSDYYNHRVMKWEEGAKEGIDVTSGQGNSPTQLSYPNGVVVDQLGTVYVADYYNDRILCWSKGVTQRTVIVGGNHYGTSSNQLARPVGLSFDRHGNLYVVDYGNNRVQEFKIA
ncbi:unnamed protein product [Rotaria sp. Silwood2]|nr:unnamed protein product [Rotaria sp. Silwood2]